MLHEAALKNVYKPEKISRVNQFTKKFIIQVRGRDRIWTFCQVGSGSGQKVCGSPTLVPVTHQDVPINKLCFIRICIQFGSIPVQIGNGAVIYCTGTSVIIGYFSQAAYLSVCFLRSFFLMFNSKIMPQSAPCFLLQI
jgi:hypothetical protein